MYHADKAADGHVNVFNACVSKYVASEVRKHINAINDTFTSKTNTLPFITQQKISLTGAWYPPGTFGSESIRGCI